MPNRIGTRLKGFDSAPARDTRPLSRGTRSPTPMNSAVALLRAQALPAAELTASDILALQRTVGNRAAQQFLSSSTEALSTHPKTSQPVIQAKLAVGPADDHYEREADRIAEQIAGPASEAGREAVGRQPDRKPEAQDNPHGTAITPLIQRLPDPERLPARSNESSQDAAADNGFESSLRASRGGGSTLAEPLRSRMESAFGADFSHVRVHTDASAAKLNREIGARAFTHGADIYFRPGDYDPGSERGTRLLAHELTHVVQQNAVQQTQARPTAIQRKIAAEDKPKEVLKDLDDDSNLQKRSKLFKALRKYFRIDHHSINDTKATIKEHINGVSTDKRTVVSVEGDKKSTAARKKILDHRDKFLKEMEAFELTKARETLHHICGFLNEWENERKQRQQQNEQPDNPDAIAIVGTNGKITNKAWYSIPHPYDDKERLKSWLDKGIEGADSHGSQCIKKADGQRYELKFLGVLGNQRLFGLKGNDNKVLFKDKLTRGLH